MLLATHVLALGVAVMVFAWMIFLHRRNREAVNPHPPARDILPPRTAAAVRPNTWLAVRSLEAQAVRLALPKRDEFAIGPRVNGWVIVTGRGLPRPGDDVDRCFRFLSALSRRLGHVQFFHLDTFSAHHAWARMDEGCVTRAYAWAGETIWNQGATTLAENELGMNCSGYGEDADMAFGRTREKAAANVEKIPRLAARWSLNPEILPRAGSRTGDRAVGL